MIGRRDQSGYIAGALIGQNPFNLQNSTKARRAPGSLVHVYRDLWQCNWAKQSECVTSLDKNTVVIAIALLTRVGHSAQTNNGA